MEDIRYAKNARFCLRIFSRGYIEGRYYFSTRPSTAGIIRGRVLFEEIRYVFCYPDCPDLLWEKFALVQFLIFPGYWDQAKGGVFNLVLCYTASFYEQNLMLSMSNGILLSKLFWPTVRKNCPSDRDIFLRYETEDRKFARFLKSIELFIQTVTGQNNYRSEQFLVTKCFFSLFQEVSHT